MATYHDPPGARRPFWRPGRNGPGWLWLLLSLIPVAVVIAIVFMVLSDDAGTPIAEGPHAPATVSIITQDPDKFYGDEVTVSGTIENVLSPRAFTIGGKEYFGGGELLVVTTKPFAPVQDRPPTAPVAEDDIIQVTGTLRKFDLADVEKETGIDLEDGALGGFAGRPVLVAEYFAHTPRVSAPEQPPASASLRAIAEQPINFYDRSVTVGGTISRVVAPRSFLLGDILVVHGLTSSAGPALQEGASVQVTGPVRRFNLANVETEIGADLQDGLYAGFNGKPVIVATAVNRASTVPAVAPPRTAASPTAQASAAVRSISITVRSDSLEPSQITLPTDVPVHVEIRNQGAPCLFYLGDYLRGLLLPTGGSGAVTFTAPASSGSARGAENAVSMGCVGSEQRTGDVRVVPGGE